MKWHKGEVGYIHFLLSTGGPSCGRVRSEKKFGCPGEQKHSNRWYLPDAKKKIELVGWVRLCFQSCPAVWKWFRVLLKCLTPREYIRGQRNSQYVHYQNRDGISPTRAGFRPDPGSDR